MVVRSLRGFVIAIVIAIIVIGVPIVQLVRPVPQAAADVAAPLPRAIPGEKPVIHWPSQGEAALMADGVGSFGTYGPQVAVPIASVTKVMTAYLVLQKHPLQLGQQGPSITITPDDVKVYQQDKALGQSVVKVAAGEQITEYEALEGLLLPSGNNMGTLLAKWCDGSVQAFVREMNATAKRLGMTETHYADPTGYSPASQSDAVDQMKLFALAMQNPVFRQIVGEAQAELPVAGLVYNVDSVVGHGTIIGGKTGSTLEAGGCFVFAARKVIGGREVLIIGAVLGQKGPQPLAEALNAAVAMSQDAQKALRSVPLVFAGQTVGTLSAPWAKPVSLVATEPVQVIGWGGLPVKQSYRADVLDSKKPIAANQVVGQLQIQVGAQTVRVPVAAASSVPAPTLSWRMKRL
ncbi:D-alanyl-D-alanine carboxypeptidase family protein [Alicyclobacillus acidocaldarius]|uniref:Peptidase S11 D-alanyl-D-alanine carboxypeptidase 1 n=1 Tax=Alicyclobacillus acidocaldarius (strain Tc-4-1) TaxID=1048834 RepID=F8ICF5_ALIAT|nr:D-alanyl-D-alanine carboxypeptidase [Alicyclobacillus acidocaldarius]AEJ42431.1 peptidase S11 D-alanyl-D-alanine carboxypeptidase 1 [Alicyclobacillus acidocaldarius subsp. acidocaldarius Tc-4-1]